MPSEMSLKLLIALNAVQIFITVLLVATLASTGINSRSQQSGYGTMAAPEQSGDSASSNALHPVYDGAPGNEPPGAEPPAEGSQAGVNASAGAAPAPGGSSKVSSRTQVILRTYLNLVSRRLKLAAEDSNMDAAPFLSSVEELNLAVSSQDVTSTEFTTVTTKLEEGYNKLGLEFPAPPQSKPTGGGQ